MELPAHLCLADLDARTASQTRSICCCIWGYSDFRNGLASFDRMFSVGIRRLHSVRVAVALIEGFCRVPHRRLDLDRPSPKQRQLQTQPIFIDEEDRAALSPDPSVAIGEVACRHARSAGSSRSMAWRTGRWQMKPN